MKKICKFVMLIAMLTGLSQGAWALSGELAYFAKAKAKVSTKSNGYGEVYIGPAIQFASADEVTCYNGDPIPEDKPFAFADESYAASHGMEVGMPYFTRTPSLTEMSQWMAPQGELATIFRGIGLMECGAALPVYAAYMAQPYPGYYFKGWSLVNNDVALGNVNPFCYPISSQAMSKSAEAKEVYAKVGGQYYPMSQYVAEGNSNRYLYVEKNWMYRTGEDCHRNGNEPELYVYECFRDESGDYQKFAMPSPMGNLELYIPFRDNVNRRFYVIDDNGERVEKFDGKYLPLPDDKDASYIIFKVGGQFMLHRYDAAALAACMENPESEAAMWDCVNATMMTYSQGGEPLVVKLQNIMVNGEDYPMESGLAVSMQIPAPAMVAKVDCPSEIRDYTTIQFLPAEEDVPVGPTMYATFAPVQINGCTGGNIVNWNNVTDNTFNVTFSTSYASSIADFGAVTFDKQPDGGAYSAVVTGYNDNEVTIAVTFTPTGSLEDGEYKASMTLPSKGGESYVSCLVNVRVGEEANKAVAIGDEKYDDLASALAAANAGDELVVLSNLTEDATIAKNITLNLDGWTLTGNVTVNSTLTLKNGTIEGNIANAGTLAYDNVTLNGTLNNTGIATLKRGVLNGQSAVAVMTSGTITLEKGVEVISNVCGVYMTAGTGTVNGAKFYGSAPFNIAGGEGVFNSGYFTQEFAEMAAMGMTHYDVTVGSAFEAGYTHLYAKDLAAAQAAGAPVCKIGQTGYSSLEDALLYAQNNPTQEVTIIMTNDYTLKAGYYTLPANASLLIPYSEEQTAIMGIHPKKMPISESYTTPSKYLALTFADGVHMSVAGNIEASSVQCIEGIGKAGCSVPTGKYGWLRLEKGAEIIMGNGSHLFAWGFVTGEGEIDVRRGGSVHEMFQVYDWPGGSNAIGMLMNAVLTGAGSFPVTQYFMQNVESQTTFHPGARMYASFGATAANIQVAADEIQIVGIDGDVAMFLMNPNADQDNTWVRKRYDIENDIQVWEVNSGANLGSMFIDVPVIKNFTGGGISGFDSRNFILPLTNNLKIHLLSGYMGISQNTQLLPGAEIEIDKESTVELWEASDPSSGFLYLIDKEDWKWIGLGGNPAAQQIRYSPSWDIPDHDGTPNVRELWDPTDDAFANAKVNVHGTFSVSGQVMTTEHGASIVSTNEDAGTIVYNQNVNFLADLDGDGVKETPVQMNVANIPNSVFDIMDFPGLPIPQWIQSQGGVDYMFARTALLRNGIGEPITSGGLSTNGANEDELVYSEELGQYVPAILAPQWDGTINFSTGQPYETPDDYTRPGESFCYMGDRWTKMTHYEDEANKIFAYDNYDEWYIKPAEYIAVASVADPDGEFAGISTKPLENPDHTYSDAAGEGRLFIWVVPDNWAPGQWWEVTLEDNLYKGKNGTYYTFSEEDNAWIEASYWITFLNWDGKPILDHNDDNTIYVLHYGDRIQYLGTNPTREENVDYTYNFTGWSPALTAESKVTGDATYTATFEAVQRKYTVIFLNENGTEIERHFLTRDEMPVCEALPSKTGYYLQWTPAIGAVTGDAEYRATFLPEPPTEFTVTFLNNDGSKIHTYENIVKGTKANTIFTEETPIKIEFEGQVSEYDWTFSGWQPAITADMTIEDNMTFTAQYSKQERKCAVVFLDMETREPMEYEGTEMLDMGDGEFIPVKYYKYGEVPVAPYVEIPEDDQNIYSLSWVLLDMEDGPTEQPISAINLAQLEAQVIAYAPVPLVTPKKYTITCVGEGCAFTGAGCYEYGTEITLTLAAQTNYENAQWSDGTTGDKVITVTGDVTFTASATLNPGEDAQLFTITFVDENDNQIIKQEKLINTVPSCDYKITPEVQYLTTWSPAIQRVRRDITYKATPVLRQYTITCEGEHCIFTGAGTYDYGTEVTLTLSAADGYENAQWSDGTTEDKVITVTGDATYTASATLIPEPEPEPEDLIAEIGSSVDLHDASIEYATLTLKSNGSNSGDLRGIANVMVTGAVNYDLEQNMAARTWYAVAVPWEVNADDGVMTLAGTQLVLGTDVDFVYYDGAERAANGASDDCWKYVELSGDHTLKPGVLYMAYLLNAQNGLRFQKKTDASLIYDDEVSVEGYASQTGSGTDANWNGIANPATFHAMLETGATYGQFYISEEDGYTPPMLLASEEFFVGRSVFVQVPEARSVVVNATSTTSAPMRVQEAAAERYDVQIAANGTMADRIYVATEEGKADEYVIVKDLAKMGVSTKKAQMWVDRYDARLCVNTTATTNPTFPLSIYAPVADTYTLSLSTVAPGVAVYLTQNGVAIANLSNGAYTLSLPAGTTTEFGLRIGKQGIATGLDEAIVEKSDATEKVMVDGILYLIHNDRVFSADGRLLK